jgi:hypothetical protein
LETLMKRFLAVFTGSAAARARWEALTQAERDQRHAAGFRAWGDWMAKHQKSIIEGGAPLGRTKLVATAGVSDIRNNLAAFVIVQTETHEAAARLFEGHPHFTLFPGEGVEVMECLPIPGA